jgi:hypothetical protein
VRLEFFQNHYVDNLLDHDGPLFFLDEIALWYTDNIGFESVHFQKSLKNRLDIVLALVYAFVKSDVIKFNHAFKNCKSFRSIYIRD